MILQIPISTPIQARIADDLPEPHADSIKVVEVKERVTYDRLLYDVARPLITIYVDPSLPRETIRTVNPFDWPEQPVVGRIYHVDSETWHIIQSEYMLTTGCTLSDLPFKVKYINTGT